MELPLSSRRALSTCCRLDLLSPDDFHFWPLVAKSSRRFFVFQLLQESLEFREYLISASVGLSILVQVSRCFPGRPVILFSLLKWHGNNGKKANVGVRAHVYKRLKRRRRSGALSQQSEREKIECTWVKRGSAPVIKHSGTRAINLAKAKEVLSVVVWFHGNT